MSERVGAQRPRGFLSGDDAMRGIESDVAARRASGELSSCLSDEQAWNVVCGERNRALRDVLLRRRPMSPEAAAAVRTMELGSTFADFYVDAQEATPT